MNKSIVGILSFIFGATLGFGASYFLLKKKFDDDLQKVADDSFLEGQNDILKQQYGGDDSQETAEFEKDISKLEEMYENVLEDFEKTENSPVSEAINYEKYSKSVKSKKIGENIIQGMANGTLNKAEKEHPEEDDIKGIEFIDEDQYSEDCLYYDKRCLKFYLKDTELKDENDEVIFDPHEIIGGWAMLHVASEANEDGYVFVRNNNLGADYEIKVIDDLDEEALRRKFERGLQREEGDDDD